MKRPSSSSFKSRGGIQRIARAFSYSCQGIRSAYIHEAAFRQELLLCLVALPIAFWLSKSWSQFFILVASLLFILIVELLNSAVETLADAVQPDYHPLVGRAKDIGSAAVLLSFVVAICVWAAVLIPNYF
ncbi:MAG TPA: diacylglycerol kinase [Paenalcaligenes sp.]|nr:diacylglycerol kinase [Paenalcaligenes sp.]